MRTAHRSILFERRRQRGVTLIVALIVLIIIALTSASVMRSALVSDQVANNSRTQTLAAQAADVALRYCEQQVQTCAAPFNCLAAPAAGAPGAWTLAGNWFGAGRAAAVNVVPASKVNSVGIVGGVPLFSAATLPECIVESAPAALGATTFVVTARGFSPDYAANPATGKTVAGSVVWVQSIIKY